MKKYCALLLTIFLFSCGNGLKKEGNMYTGKMLLENGEGAKSEISYKVCTYTVDTLKLSTKTIEGLLEETAGCAKSTLKNPLTLEFMPSPKVSAIVYSFPSDSIIKVSFNCTGKNGFGVKKGHWAFADYEKGTLRLIASY